MKRQKDLKMLLTESGLSVEFDEQNAQNDQNNNQTIANNFVRR